MENNKTRFNIEYNLKLRKIDYFKIDEDEHQKTYRLFITSMLDTFVQLEYDEQGVDANFYIRMFQGYHDIVDPLVWSQETDQPNGVNFEDVLDEFVSKTNKLAECFFKVKDKINEIKFIFQSYNLDSEDFISISNNLGTI